MRNSNIVSWITQVCSELNSHKYNTTVGTTRDVPRGYSTAADVPVLRGPNHCEHCLCTPCVISKPPHFLRGSCDPHPANSEKRHMLYKRFWRCLSTLGVWKDEDYLRRKEARTALEDKRDIIPKCITEVCKFSEVKLLLLVLLLLLFRKSEGDTLVTTVITGTILAHLMPVMTLLWRT